MKILTKIIIIIIGVFILVAVLVYSYLQIVKRPEIPKKEIINEEIELLMGEHSYNFKDDTKYIVKGYDITLQLACEDFLNVVDKEIDVSSPNITLVNNDATFSFLVKKDTCHKETVMISDDLAVSCNTDCEIEIKKQPISQAEAIINNLQDASFNITTSKKGEFTKFYHFDNGRFIYLNGYWPRYKDDDLGVIEVVTNFGSYNARLAYCFDKKRLGTVRIGPEKMEILCGIKDAITEHPILEVKYLATNWPVKILYFEPAPSYYGHGPTNNRIKEIY